MVIHFKPLIYTKVSRKHQLKKKEIKEPQKQWSKSVSKLGHVDLYTIMMHH